MNLVYHKKEIHLSPFLPLCVLNQSMEALESLREIMYVPRPRQTTKTIVYEFESVLILRIIVIFFYLTI